jgi:flagellar basal-body rod protein FlgC
VLGVERISTPPRRVYEPSHPQADSRGFVHFPGIDQLSEMTTLMKAVRVYEANVAVFGASRSMALKALDIGGRG